MEKIKSAIEEAKKRSSGNSDIEETANHKAAVASQKPDHGDTEVRYNKTRIVNLRNEHLAKNRIVSYNKNDHISLGFDILRTQILKKMKDNNWRTIAITSPTPACGKTVVAINLAMSIAHNTDTTAMLVDFDFRRPSVSKYLGLPLGPSLNDVLSGEAEIADVLINPGLERMVVLPTSRPVAHSSEVLSSQKVRNMIAELRDRYAERIVIFDLTPILGSDDAMTVLSQVDCALMVVGNGMVTKPELTESLRHIDSNKLVGTVLNKSDKKGQTDYYI